MDKSILGSGGGVVNDRLNSPAVRAALQVLSDALEQPEVLTRLVSRDSQNAKIVELWNLGYSMTEIAARLQMNRGTVSSRLHLMGVV